jgi:hypothetical protein
LGSPKLPAAARGIPARIHPAVFEAAPSEQTGPQDPHQGERVDGHRHQVRLWSGGGRSYLPKDKQPQGRQQEDVPEASAQQGTNKKAKKKSQAKRDAADADLVADVEHRNPRKPPGGANLFDKLLKESCPYHQGPVKHTLEVCVMLWHYFHKARPSAEGGKGQDNDKKEGDKAEEFPDVTPLVLRELKLWHDIICICIILLDIPRMHFTRSKIRPICGVLFC